MLEKVFWLFIFIIFYAYFGYPMLLFIISLFINNCVRKKEITPYVTFLITAFNEEKSIKIKLENTLSLEYPSDKLEIIVASDGSTDETDDIVKDYFKEKVKLIRVEGRLGKTESQNRAVKIAQGEIIVFSDADSIYNSDALRKLVRNFIDTNVGVVAGKTNYITNKNTLGIGTKIFWTYELLIKQAQSKLKTLTGVSGCIYALRKDLYVPLSADIISDLVEPLKIIEKGFRVVYEPEAVAYEKTRETSASEFTMRIRVISRGMRGLLNMRKLLNPFKYGLISFQIFSHKIIRWFVFFFMVGLFICNLFLLEKKFYFGFFIGQLIFYALALLGLLFDLRGRRIKIFTIPLYFCVINFASFIALFKLAKGTNTITWDTERNKDVANYK